MSRTALVPDVLLGTVRTAAVPMAVVEVGTGVVLEASPAFEAVLRAPLVGVSLLDSFPEAEVLHGLLTSAGAGVATTGIFALGALGIGTGASATVDRLEWEWAATPIPDADGGGTAAVLLSSADVSTQAEVAERVEVLEGLVYLSRRLAEADDEATLYGLLATDIATLLGAESCVVLRLDTGVSRDPRVRVVRPVLPAHGVDEAQLADLAPIALDPGSVGWRVVFEGETFATEDVAGDPELDEYRDFFRRIGARNGAAIPMRVRSATLTILLVFNKPSGFTARDLRYAEVFAAEAALALENTRLFAEEHRTATTLQEALLPGPVPEVPTLDLFAIYRAAGPAGSVGGDFYDVFHMHDALYGMLLGDVSGKGPRAAAQTALVRHMARGLALNEDVPGPVVGELNNAVWEQSATEGFITMLFGVYDSTSSQLRWANAGHPPPLFLRRGRPAIEVGMPGRALGIGRHADVRVDRRVLVPGDVMVWYTDGLSEARRPGGTMLGTSSLLRTLEGLAEHPAEDVAEAMYRRAVAHCGRLEDDVAILVIRRTDV